MSYNIITVVSRNKNKNQKIPAIMIVGPTSSGKTGLSLKLASLINSEIISADSRQVYREIEVGTNKVRTRTHKIFRGEYASFVKPPKTGAKNVGNYEDQILVAVKKWLNDKKVENTEVQTPRDQVPHYLIDNISLNERYSLGGFARDSFRIAGKIYRSGKVPIVVGGTGQYAKALAEGWFGTEISIQGVDGYDDKETGDLYKLLTDIDPEYAGKIEENNRRRIIHALVAIDQCGEKYSEVQKRAKSKWLDPFIIGLNPERAGLYKTIDKAIEERFGSGLLEEINKLIEIGFTKKRIDDLGLSYRWGLRMLEDGLQIDEAVQKAKYEEHALVRRQLAWFRKIPGVKWFS